MPPHPIVHMTDAHVDPAAVPYFSLILGELVPKRIALGHPDRVRSLQLHGTAARPDRYMLALIENLRTVRRGSGPEAAQRAMALWLFAPTTFNERPQLVESLLHAAAVQPYPQSEVGFIRQGDAVISHDALARLGRVSCPTLVAVGEEDQLTPPRFARELARAIPHVELRTIPAAGHASFWEQPTDFNTLCLNFLSKQS